MENKFSVPTETIELPSKGLLYSSDSPLSSGKIEMKYMTAKEEDILTNQSYIQKGIVLDKLFQSLIVSDINYDDLLVGDKDAIMLAARVLGYGKEYTFNYDGEEYNVDLTRWANQGVLLLNSALTCEIDKAGSHHFVWKDFIAYTMDMLNYTDSGLKFVLMGKQAQELESMIGEHHHIIKVSHPASAAYTKTTWDCGDMFNACNNIIEGQNGPTFKINW